MTFMNKKEEIIEFELTTYGRHLLSQGKLKPEFYAFFDDDVLSDIGKAGGSETAGEIKKRILEETPYLRCPVSYQDLDKNLYKTGKTLVDDHSNYPNDDERLFGVEYQIGTSDPVSGQLSPYWEIKYLHGNPSSVNKTLNNPSDNISLPNKNIPQLNFNLDYLVEIKNTNYEEYDTDFLDSTNPNLPVMRVAEDGTYMSIKEQQMLLYILEKNGFNYNDSFEIEVFIKEDDGSKYKPLMFFDPRIPDQRVENDILLENQEFDINYDPSFVDDVDDPRFVEHYFNFRIDKEIPEEDVCNGILNLKVRDIFVDLEYDCMERDAASSISIYSSRITDADIEDCE